MDHGFEVKTIFDWFDKAIHTRNIGTRGWRNYNVSMSIEAFRNETIVTLYDRLGSDVIQGRNKATYLGPVSISLTLFRAPNVTDRRR